MSDTTNGAANADATDTPTSPAPELPDNFISFTIGGMTTITEIGDDVGDSKFIYALKDFTPERQAVLLGENSPKLTINLIGFNNFTLFTARDAAGNHAYFGINGDGRLEVVDPSKIILVEDYFYGDGDDGDDAEGDGTNTPAEATDTVEGGDAEGVRPT